MARKPKLKADAQHIEQPVAEPLPLPADECIPPSYLSDEERKLFISLARQIRFFSATEVSMLAEYCYYDIAIQELFKAARGNFIQTQDTSTGGKKVITNPRLAVAKNFAQLKSKLASQLGIGVQARKDIERKDGVSNKTRKGRQSSALKEFNTQVKG